MPRSVDGRRDAPQRPAPNTRYSGWLDLYGTSALAIFLGVLVVLGFILRH